MHCTKGIPYDSLILSKGSGNNRKTALEAVPPGIQYLV